MIGPSGNSNSNMPKRSGYGTDDLSELLLSEKFRGQGGYLNFELSSQTNTRYCAQPHQSNYQLNVQKPSNPKKLTRIKGIDNLTCIVSEILVYI
jgi:hypothetical protein